MTFEEAQTVFCDENAILFDDPEHSEYENRFLIIGFTSKARICIVSHCYRESDSVIRIIPARRATTSEKNYYNKENGGNRMREEYDIKSLNPRKNPYSKRIKQQITINIDSDVVNYFKEKSEFLGIPYQTLINLYLSDCMKNQRELHMVWE